MSNLHFLLMYFNITSLCVHIFIFMPETKLDLKSIFINNSLTRDLNILNSYYFLSIKISIEQFMLLWLSQVGSGQSLPGFCSFVHSSKKARDDFKLNLLLDQEVFCELKLDPDLELESDRLGSRSTKLWTYIRSNFRAAAFNMTGGMSLLG